MNKKIIIGIITLVFLSAVTVIVKNNGQQSAVNSVNETANEIQVPNVKIYAEKIEVVHFHGTRQCWTCITVGKYALKTIREKLSKDYQDGTIIFKDINVELPENTDIVIKYQARGSSLFVNAITGGRDIIEEDIKVWSLVTDETQFVDYFEKKLKNLLGK